MAGCLPVLPCHLLAFFAYLSRINTRLLAGKAAIFLVLCLIRATWPPTGMQRKIPNKRQARHAAVPISPAWKRFPAARPRTDAPNDRQMLKVTGPAAIFRFIFKLVSRDLAQAARILATTNLRSA
jgi:hypothetical protein